MKVEECEKDGDFILTSETPEEDKLIEMLEADPDLLNNILREYLDSLDSKK